MTVPCGDAVHQKLVSDAHLAAAVAAAAAADSQLAQLSVTVDLQSAHAGGGPVTGVPHAEIWELRAACNSNHAISLYPWASISHSTARIAIVCGKGAVMTALCTKH